MIRLTRLVLLSCSALAILSEAHAQARKRPEPAKIQSQMQALAGQPQAPAETAARKPVDAPNDRPRPGAITSVITLADVGFSNGFRFANLGGRRDLFVPLPQGAEITAGD
jgi:hypothetical protein